MSIVGIVERCAKVVPNRFELLMLAMQRVRGIVSGAVISGDNKGRKQVVIALREIGNKEISCHQLYDSVLQSYQVKHKMNSETIMDAKQNQKNTEAEIAEEEKKQVYDELDEESMINNIDKDVEGN